MNQHPVSPIPVVPCPVCGADPEARSWFKTFRGAYGVGSVSLDIESGGIFSNTPLPTFPLVCTRCGYIQFFVDVGELHTKQAQAEEKRKHHHHL